MSVTYKFDWQYLLVAHLPTSCRTPSLAQSSSSLEAPSPVLLTCFPGAAAVQVFTGRATGGRRPPRMCLAWRGCWKLGPWLSFHRASLPPPGLKDHLTPMSLYCPSSWDPAWAFGGSATSGGRSMLRYVGSVPYALWETCTRLTVNHFCRLLTKNNERKSLY